MTPYDLDGGPLEVSAPDLARQKIERRLQWLIDSPLANRCVTCGHVKHNDLGNCQTGQCICGDGTTIAGLAGIIRRDLHRVEVTP